MLNIRILGFSLLYFKKNYLYYEILRIIFATKFIVHL